MARNRCPIVIIHFRSFENSIKYLLIQNMEVIVGTYNWCLLTNNSRVSVLWRGASIAMV